MSNDIVPVLEHIDDEEHDKENCCVKYIDTKTFKGLEYYIFVRKCECDKELLSKKFWHTKSTCFYKTMPQFPKAFKITEFCTCDQPRNVYEGR